MKEKKTDKSKFITAIVVSILIFFFIGGFLLGLDRIKAMEGTFPPNEIKESLSSAPESADDVVSFLYEMLKKAADDVPALTYDNYFSSDSASLSTDGSEYFTKTLQFGMENFISHISSFKEDDTAKTSVAFGEDVKSVLRMPNITADDVASFSCNYIYYSCPSCGKTSDEQLEQCEDCGSLRTYFLKYRDNYDIEIIIDISDLASENNVLLRNYNRRTNEQIYDMIGDELKEAADVTIEDIKYDSLRICFSVDRLKNEINSLRYIKDMNIVAAVSFKGDYSELGQKNVAFGLQENSVFHFTWPSLVLSDEKLVIEPTGTDNLLATLVCEDPLAMTVTWSSSDESIAVVDSEGYIDTFKKTGEAIITASFEYLGKTYTDRCTVYVRVPVESMKMKSAKKLTLSVGETATLETKVSPSDATVQTVTWYTEDESIATVDANGVVTAIAEGTVVVYALSDDGYYRSTCEVTVE